MVAAGAGCAVPRVLAPCTHYTPLTSTAAQKIGPNPEFADPDPGASAGVTIITKPTTDDRHSESKKASPLGVNIYFVATLSSTEN